MKLTNRGIYQTQPFEASAIEFAVAGKQAVRLIQGGQDGAKGLIAALQPRLPEACWFRAHNRQSTGDTMPKVERIRELMRVPVGPEYFKEKAAAGWKLVAIEWQREIEGRLEEPQTFVEDVPFGLRVAADCQHLEENPTETDILVLMMDLIVQDQPLSKVADGLNQAGFRTRQGLPWSPVSVFNMLPRLIEVGPHIFSSEQWMARRERLMRVV
jgi:hypothetical protein